MVEKITLSSPQLGPWTSDLQTGVAEFEQHRQVRQGLRKGYCVAL